MAIAINTQSNNGTSNTTSHSHTVNTGLSGVVLVVSIKSKDSAITAVTYNGTSLTKAVEKWDGSDYSYVWYLANPDTGTNTLSVTGGSTRWTQAYTLTGCHTSSPIDTTGTNNYGTWSNGANRSISPTTTYDNSLIVGVFNVNDNASGFTPQGSTVEQWETTDVNAFIAIHGYLTTTTAGAYSLTWKNNTGGNYNASGCAAAIKEKQPVALGGYIM